MKKLLFFYLAMLSISLATAQQQIHIYVEKYLDGNKVASSVVPKVGVQLTAYHKKKSTVLKREGPVFVYDNKEKMYSLRITFDKTSFLVTDSKVLKNKLLVIKIEDQSDCQLNEYAVFYDNGGYIRVLQSGKESCDKKISIIKPWFTHVDDKWESNYHILLPYQLDGLQ